MTRQDLIEAENAFDIIIKSFIDSNIDGKTGIFGLALGLGHTAALYELDFDALVVIARTMYEADVARHKAKDEANK